MNTDTDSSLAQQDFQILTHLLAVVMPDVNDRNMREDWLQIASAKVEIVIDRDGLRIQTFTDYQHAQYPIPHGMPEYHMAANQVGWETRFFNDLLDNSIVRPIREADVVCHIVFESSCRFGGIIDTYEIAYEHMPWLAVQFEQARLNYRKIKKGQQHDY